MKKQPENNSKITDYFHMKSITPIGRILNKPVTVL